MNDGFDINKCGFRLDRRIGVGGTGSVFKETANNEITCVVKKQLRKDDKSLIKEEEVYLALKKRDDHFPVRYYFGKYGQERILVLSRHGKDLYDLTVEQKGLSLEKIAVAVMQITDALERLHKQGFIHRDIKPENIMVGKYYKNKLKHHNNLFLIDFGSASRFQDWEGVHIQPGNILTDHGGTEAYGSLRFHKKQEQSRRDDLISLCYTIVFLHRQTLPWAHLMNKPTEMIKMKSKISADSLFKGFPKEFRDAFLYVNSLDFYKKPSYKTVKRLMLRYLDNSKRNKRDFSFLK